VVPVSDVWLPVPGSGRDFYNATRRAELVALGLVPELAKGPGLRSQGLAEVRHPVEPAREGNVMSVAAPKKPARAKRKSKMAGLSKTALRKNLLETVTISASVWKAYREDTGCRSVRAERPAWRSSGECWRERPIVGQFAGRTYDPCRTRTIP
jgi:hypothetical protein